MPKKSKGQKFIFKVNDKKLLIICLNCICIYVGYIYICYKRCKCGRQFYA